ATLGVQYHFATGGTWHPYVGVGVTYMHFFDEHDRVNGIEADVKDATGASGQVGMDVRLEGKWLLNADVRYVDLDTTARLRGMFDQNVDMTVDPWLVSVGLGYLF
ncbi:MAG TPA: OmpW family outer membrane protein, partial [Gammaproteobacteria bacterium]|nr:OmpW family outer membrane protein [Gammaproteobacteria bacterium]